MGNNFKDAVEQCQLPPQIKAAILNKIDIQKNNEKNNLSDSKTNQVLMVDLTSENGQKLSCTESEYLIFKDVNNVYSTKPDISFRKINDTISEVILKGYDDREIKKQVNHTKLKNIYFVNAKDNDFKILREFSAAKNEAEAPFKETSIFKQYLPFDTSASYRENVQSYLTKFHYDANIVEINQNYNVQNDAKKRKSQNEIYVIDTDKVKSNFTISDTDGRNTLVLNAKEKDKIHFEYSKKDQIFLVVNGKKVTLDFEDSFITTIATTDQGKFLHLWQRLSFPQPQMFRKDTVLLADLERLFTGVSNLQIGTRLKTIPKNIMENSSFIRQYKQRKFNSKHSSTRFISSRTIEENIQKCFYTDIQNVYRADKELKDIVYNNQTRDLAVATADNQSLNCTGGKDTYYLSDKFENIFIADTEGKNRILIGFSNRPCNVEVRKTHNNMAEIVLKKRGDEKILATMASYQNLASIQRLSSKNGKGFEEISIDHLFND